MERFDWGDWEDQGWEDVGCGGWQLIEQKMSRSFWTSERHTTCQSAPILLHWAILGIPRFIEFAHRYHIIQQGLGFICEENTSMLYAPELWLPRSLEVMDNPTILRTCCPAPLPLFMFVIIVKLWMRHVDQSPFETKAVWEYKAYCSSHQGVLSQEIYQVPRLGALSYGARL